MLSDDGQIEQLGPSALVAAASGLWVVPGIVLELGCVGLDVPVTVFGSTPSLFGRRTTTLLCRLCAPLSLSRRKSGRHACQLYPSSASTSSSFTRSSVQNHHHQHLQHRRTAPSLVAMIFPWMSNMSHTCSSPNGASNLYPTLPTSLIPVPPKLFNSKLFNLDNELTHQVCKSIGFSHSNITPLSPFLIRQLG
ncbi:hypothetical protein AHAS_Ahas03G0262700 [Arachis hypogaea]